MACSVSHQGKYFHCKWKQHRSWQTENTGDKTQTKIYTYLQPCSTKLFLRAVGIRCFLHRLSSLWLEFAIYWKQSRQLKLDDHFQRISQQRLWSGTNPQPTRVNRLWQTSGLQSQRWCLFELVVREPDSSRIPPDTLPHKMNNVALNLAAVFLFGLLAKCSQEHLGVFQFWCMFILNSVKTWRPFGLQRAIPGIDHPRWTFGMPKCWLCSNPQVGSFGFGWVWGEFAIRTEVPLCTHHITAKFICLWGFMKKLSVMPGTQCWPHVTQRILVSFQQLRSQCWPHTNASRGVRTKKQTHPTSVKILRTTKYFVFARKSTSTKYWAWLLSKQSEYKWALCGSTLELHWSALVTQGSTVSLPQENSLWKNKCIDFPRFPITRHLPEYLWNWLWIIQFIHVFCQCWLQNQEMYLRISAAPGWHQGSPRRWGSQGKIPSSGGGIWFHSLACGFFVSVKIVPVLICYLCAVGTLLQKRTESMFGTKERCTNLEDSRPTLGGCRPGVLSLWLCHNCSTIKWDDSLINIFQGMRVFLFVLCFPDIGLLAMIFGAHQGALIAVCSQQWVQSYNLPFAFVEWFALKLTEKMIRVWEVCCFTATPTGSWTVVHFLKNVLVSNWLFKKKPHVLRKWQKTRKQERRCRYGKGLTLWATNTNVSSFSD